MIDYYFALRTLAVAWAWAGNWVTKDRSGRDALMMDLIALLWDMQTEPWLIARHLAAYSLTWLARNDLQTRGTMASLMRQQWSASEALKEALRQHWKSPALQGVLHEPELKRRSPDPPGGAAPDHKRARMLKADGLVTVSMVKRRTATM